MKIVKCILRLLAVTLLVTACLKVRNDLASDACLTGGGIGMKSKTYAKDTEESVPLPDQNGSMRKNQDRSATGQQRVLSH